MSTLRLALSQFPACNEIPTAEVLAMCGARIREDMRTAAAAGARLVQFPEGTLTYPHKRVISSRSPELAEADWTKVDWPALRAELEAIAATARDLGIWTVVGAPHRLARDARPHNSLYVFSDRGELVTRYDKRRLSTTEITYLYAPGTEGITFEVDGFRIGLVLCLETLFPDLFVDYADAGADLVLISSAGGGIFGQLAQAYAAITQTSIALAIPPAADDASRTGVCGPFGWLGQCTDGNHAVMTVEVPHRQEAPTFHYLARHGLYDGRHPHDDPRSLDRSRL